MLIMIVTRLGNGKIRASTAIRGKELQRLMERIERCGFLNPMQQKMSLRNGSKKRKSKFCAANYLIVNPMVFAKMEPGLNRLKPYQGKLLREKCLLMPPTKAICWPWQGYPIMWEERLIACTRKSGMGYKWEYFSMVIGLSRILTLM